MTLLIADSLDIAARAGGWKIGESTSADTAYSGMLVATRMVLAAALLCFGTKRDVPSPSSTAGEVTAFKAISKVQVLNNWALLTTIALLYLLAVMALHHLFLLTEFRMHLALLQVMEMQQNTPMHVAPVLSGHCVETKKDAQADMQVLICASVGLNHLGMLRSRGSTLGDGWKSQKTQHVLSLTHTGTTTAKAETKGGRAWG